jgi:Zn-finger nucleic acid-binding protein
MRTQDEVAAMACPVCRVPLAMSERQGIEIDYCPQCRGVWLDRGELDKIVERSVPQALADGGGGPRPSEPLHPAGGPGPWSPGGLTHGGYGHGHGGKPGRKRKSWLEEIFD